MRTSGKGGAHLECTIKDRHAREPRRINEERRNKPDVRDGATARLHSSRPRVVQSLITPKRARLARECRNEHMPIDSHRAQISAVLADVALKRGGIICGGAGEGGHVEREEELERRHAGPGCVGVVQVHSSIGVRDLCDLPIVLAYVEGEGVEALRGSEGDVYI